MIAWKRGLSLKFRLATTNSKWSIEEKNKTPIEVPFRLCGTGQAITEAWKQDAFQWLPGLDIHDKIKMF